MMCMRWFAGKIVVVSIHSQDNTNPPHHQKNKLHLLHARECKKFARCRSVWELPTLEKSTRNRKIYQKKWAVSQLQGGKCNYFTKQCSIYTDSITHPGNCCSARTIACILENKGYSVVVHLYPNTGIRSLTEDERCFTVAIGDELLIICPPPIAEPAEVESGGWSTSAVSAQGDAELTPSETSDGECSCRSFITDYSQVDPDKDKSACLAIYLALPAGAETTSMKTHSLILTPSPCLMRRRLQWTSQTTSILRLQRQTGCDSSWNTFLC